MPMHILLNFMFIFFTYFMQVFEIFFICRDLSILLVFDFNLKSCFNQLLPYNLIGYSPNETEFVL